MNQNLSACCCRTVGTIIGWSSSGFYLGSRLSQIWKNHSRQSAEGLSLAMFACAITANVCYGLGILIRAYSWAVVRSSAPWILGSLGTVTLDLVIFTQVPHCHFSFVFGITVCGFCSVVSAVCTCVTTMPDACDGKHHMQLASKANCGPVYNFLCRCIVQHALQHSSI